MYETLFYLVLVENEVSGHDHVLHNLTIELAGQLRNSRMVDWQKCESVRARMRNLACRLLRRWTYPPDAAEEAIKLVLEQAEVFADARYK